MQDTSYQVLKKEVENSFGQTLGQLQEVTIRVQKERSNNVLHSGVIGKNDFTPNLEKILLQMRQGQKWVIQDCQKSNFKIQIVSVGKIVDNKSHYERADILKGQGNVFIKARENGKAIEKYIQAYNLLLNDPNAKSQELKLSIISNLALAALNQSDFKSSVDWCDKHLQDTVEPNVKIIYRRASANKGLRNWDQARRDIHFGIENSKGDDESISNFNKLQAQLEKQQKQQKAKEKAVYGKMFN